MPIEFEDEFEDFEKKIQIAKKKEDLNQMKFLLLYLLIMKKIADG